MNKEGISVIQITSVLLRRIRVVVGVPACLAAAVLLLHYVGGREYNATSSFLPQVSQGPLSRYASLASQFGISTGDMGGSAGESITFYADLLTSRTLLVELAQSPFAFEKDVDDGVVASGTLIELFEISGETDEERLQRAVEVLRARVRRNIDAASGVIRLETQAPWPALAVMMNRRLLDLLGEYNLTRRQSRAAEERKFAEDRMGEARQLLLEAERELQKFLEGNRAYESSPQLAFEAARLQRRVDFQQQLFAMLAQAFEQARLDEVRNTPVISVVDRPEGSAAPSGSLSVKFVAAVLFGTIAGAGLALVIEYAYRRRVEDPESFREFVDLSRSALERVVPASIVALTMTLIGRRGLASKVESTAALE